MSNYAEKLPVKLVERKIVLPTHEEDLTLKAEKFVLAIDFVVKVLEAGEHEYMKPMEIHIDGRKMFVESRETRPCVAEALKLLKIVSLGGTNWLKMRNGFDYVVPSEIVHDHKGDSHMIIEKNLDEVIFIHEDKKLVFQSILDILERYMEFLVDLSNQYESASFYYFRPQTNQILMNHIIGNLATAILLISSRCI